MKTIRKGIFFPIDALEEMERECERLDRPLHWLLVRAWQIAKERIHAWPSPEDL